MTIDQLNVRIGELKKELHISGGISRCGAMDDEHTMLTADLAALEAIKEHQDKIIARRSMTPNAMLKALLKRIAEVGGCLEPMVQEELRLEAHISANAKALADSIDNDVYTDIMRTLDTPL